MTAASVSYRAITDVVPMTSVHTPDLFKNHVVHGVSPIDRFIENTRKINLLYKSQIWTKDNWHPEFGTLMLLGYMSAVESYFRALVAGLVNLDEATRRRAGPKSLTFGVATGHPDPTLLPEVLLENTSFTSSKHVKSVLGDFLGLTNIDNANDVRFALDEFDKICEVRHCCVHRFGKLGTRNAWELGFDLHREVIERPFSPTIDEVRALSFTLVTFVRTINNYVFHAMLDRTAFDAQSGQLTWSWAWSFEADEKIFTKYYNFFASLSSEPKSGSIADVYNDFSANHLAILRSKQKKAEKAKIAKPLKEPGKPKGPGRPDEERPVEAKEAL